MFDYEQIDAMDIHAEAPNEEPLRQYYFMKKCKEWAAEEEKRLGRKLTLSMQTMGCQMNARDSEKLEAILSYIGYETVEEPVADFVLYNTCTVRENANLKVYGRLGYMKNQKKKNPAMKIAMCGCMMQEPTVVEKIQKSYPFVDLLVRIMSINWQSCFIRGFIRTAWYWISGKRQRASWKICQVSANIRLRRA